MPEPTLVDLIHSKTQPYQGLWSKPSPMSLSPGMFGISKNWRFGGLVPEVRQPMTRAGNASQTVMGSAFVGRWAGLLNGVLTHVVALADGTIYSLATATGGARTLLSASSGKYGDTRLSTLFTSVSMAPVKDNRTGKEYLIIGDGVSYPRVWDPSNTTAGERIAINQPITQPTATPGVPIALTFPKFFPINSAANTNAYATGGAGFTGADVGASTVNNYAVLTITTGVTSPGSGTDYVELEMMATVDFSDCPQLVILIDTDYTSFENNVSISIGEGATTPVLVYDPSVASTTLDRPQKIRADGSGKRWYLVYSLANVPTASRNAADTIRFAWVGHSDPNATKTVNILGVMGSGKVEGNATYAITRGSLGSHAESPALKFFPRSMSPEFTKNLGVRKDLNLVLPNHPGILY